MAKSQMSPKSSSSAQPKNVSRNAKGPSMASDSGKFNDRNLSAVSPLKEQFEPSDNEAVRQHFKMAGGC